MRLTAVLRQQGATNKPSATVKSFIFSFGRPNADEQQNIFCPLIQSSAAVRGRRFSNALPNVKLMDVVRNLSIMKVLAFLIITFFCKTGHCQTIHYTTDEGYLFNVLARHILTPDDTTGVAVLQVTKKDSLIYVRTIYNSLKNFVFLNRESLKDRESRLPDGYTRIVPIHFYFDARDGLDEKPPAKELITEANTRINNLKQKYAITEPLKLTSYGVVH